jgi:diguanylate cyclase (GGDEF)-like protein/PAS domain S-box-containing protein
LSAPSDVKENGRPVQGVEGDVERLRIARDAAIQAAQAAMRDTTRLTRLLTILSEPAPLPILLDRVLSALSELFLADVVVLLDPDGTGSYVPLAAIGLPEDLIEEPMSDAEDGYAVSVMRTRLPVLTSAADSDPKIDSQFIELGIETAVWVPVLGANAARGVLILARCNPAPFANSDVDLLTAMGGRIGMALDQAQRGAQLERLARSGRSIGMHLDEEAVCFEAARILPEMLNADATALFMLDEGGVLRRTAHSGLSPEWNETWRSLAKCLLALPAPACIRTFATSNLPTAFEGFGLEPPQACPVRSLVAIPIQRELLTQGFLFAMRFSSTSFTPDALQVAELYAAQVSAALENARLYRAAREELSVRVRAEQALRASDERYRALIRSVSDVITILNVDGLILYSSPAAMKAWGCAAEAIEGESLFDRVHKEDAQAVRELFSLALSNPKAVFNGEARLLQGDASWRNFEVILVNLLEEPAVGGIVATHHDVTERKTFERKLTKLAFRDPLTGLANRAFFRDRLRQALIRSGSEGLSVGVVFFDLDNFKIVNDSLGHAWGDKVLCTVADRLRACMRKDDTAARLGGDEFTLLVERVEGLAQVMPIVHRLNAALHDPIHLGDRDFFIGGSIGIAISAPNEDNADELLRRADIAMYHAKNSGKGCYAVFDELLNAAAIERLEMENDLRRAIEAGEFVIHYQPVVSMESGRIVEVEALVRWVHPRKGLVPPPEFIPVAEETRLIIPLGRWVLREACRQIASWRDRDGDLRLSVNLSTRQFRSEELLADIAGALRDNTLMPSALRLEMTESGLIGDPAMAGDKLKALKQLGVRLAIDDFGVGYSSLSHLKHFQVDALKIDRSFVQGVDKDEHNKAIARSIVALASTFGLHVIGEGVETREQAEQLQALGCDLMQGYLFSPPLPSADMESFLEKRLGGRRT